MWVQGTPLKVCEGNGVTEPSGWSLRWSLRADRVAFPTGPASQGRWSPGLCAHPAPLLSGAGGEAFGREEGVESG